MTTIDMTPEELRDALAFWHSNTGSDLLSDMRDWAKMIRDLRRVATRRRRSAEAAVRSSGEAR